MRLEIDDDMFPARRSLIGMQFPDEREFARALAVLAEDPELYGESYPIWTMIVVRRDDLSRFVTAGFQFVEIDQIDDDELSSEEVARRDRALIDSWKPILLQRARRPR